jgi:hypothetical protein
MRAMLMHKLDESDPMAYTPSPELIAKVGAMVGDLEKSGILRGGDGLRSSALGVRVTFAGGKRSVVKGPFPGAHREDPAALCIVRVVTIDEAVEIATRFAQVLGDGVVDIRPLTEAWDLGFGEKPKDDPTTRYMLVWKADARSERGELPSLQARAALGKLIAELTAKGTFLMGEAFKPTSQAKRIPREAKRRVIDGPFAESKELISGFVLVEIGSLAEGLPWAERYLDAVGNIELDLRPLYEPGELKG